MRADHTNPLRVYVLRADRQTWLLKTAHLSTPTTLVFELPLLASKPFLDSLEYGGCLPVREWEFIILDSSLTVLVSYIWNSLRVTRVCLPTLENQSVKPLSLAVECAVAEVKEGGPTGDAPRSSVTPSGRLPMSVLPAIQTKIDGLPEVEWGISKVETFKVGDGANKELVLTTSPERLADPFRNWLGGGNTPKDGTLYFLNCHLQIGFRYRFTGLRVRTVAPALSLNYSPTPATIRLTYTSIRF